MFMFGPLELIVVLAIVVVFGIPSAIVASRKGLNVYLGFILGAVLGIVGLVIVLIIPRKN